MKKIHQLSDSVIAKIAAGEVVERPCYALKELIENAIDAEATFIKIEIEQAGLQKIIINDNGCGMSREDITECFKPHTTSKIADESDLLKVQTLGFRGEALSSIAAISNLTIKSKCEKETAGTIVDIKAGKCENISPIGVPVGTTVIVNNLFYPVPARKKFLKSIQTEYRHILEVVINQALVHPEIRLVLMNNKKMVFDLPKNQDIITRIKALMGENIFANLIPVTHEDSYVKIFGFISRPQLTTQNNSKQFIFVNKRRINDRMIALAVKEAYGNLVEPTVYPVFILFLKIPYEMVDVNVHPRKEQIGFVNNRFIFDTVNRTVSEALISHNLIFTNLNWKSEYTAQPTRSFAGQLLKEKVLKEEEMGRILKSTDVTQIHNTYLTTQSKNGLILIDQHAAHERILYEKFIEEYEKEKSKQKKHLLVKAKFLELSFSEADFLKKNLNLFNNLGFAIEYFKDNIFKIITVPVLFKDRNYLVLIKEILEDLMVEKKISNIDMQTVKMIEYLACRSAIKAGDKLTKKAAKKLIKDLEKTKSNYTCPHGRPVKIEITLQEIARFFKRG